MYKIWVDGQIFCDSRIDALAVLNPVVTLEANAAGSFVFTIPPDHPKYDVINRRKSIISVIRENETEPIFQGICTEENIDFFKQKKITCEGELTYLNDSVLRPNVYRNMNVIELLRQYIEYHNQCVEDSKKFEVGTVTVADQNVSLFRYTNYNSTMQEIKEDLIDNYGGYIRVRYSEGHKYIDYLQDSLRTNNQVIELGKNLLDYKSNIDNTDIATIIIPLGAKLEHSQIEGLDERLTIKEVNEGKDYILSDTIDTYGMIEKTIVWDDINVASNLKAKAEKYLSEYQFENVVIEASAIDFGLLTTELDQFRVLDKIRVVSAIHGMDKYFVLTKLALNLNSPEKDRITLGSAAKLALSAKTNSETTSIKRLFEKVPDRTTIMQAVASATSNITGAEGGYIKINYDEQGNPFEILIMDTDDIETAQKVWRWNQNGLGYSSTGYNGEFGTAITQDGQIVANYITSGSLYADLIRGGILKVGGIDNANGKIEIYDYQGNYAGQIDNSGIAFYSSVTKTQIIMSPIFGVIQRDAVENEYRGLIEDKRTKVNVSENEGTRNFSEQVDILYDRDLVRQEIRTDTAYGGSTYTIYYNLYVYRNWRHENHKWIFANMEARTSYVQTIDVDVPEEFHGKDWLVLILFEGWEETVTDEKWVVNDYHRNSPPKVYDGESYTDQYWLKYSSTIPASETDLPAKNVYYRKNGSWGGVANCYTKGYYIESSKALWDSQYGAGDDLVNHLTGHLLDDEVVPARDSTVATDITENVKTAYASAKAAGKLPEPVISYEVADEEKTKLRIKVEATIKVNTPYNVFKVGIANMAKIRYIVSC